MGRWIAPESGLTVKMLAVECQKCGFEARSWCNVRFGLSSRLCLLIEVLYP